MRDQYWETWRNHPVDCMCQDCRIEMTEGDDDEQTGRYLARRHRPRECDFEGDHR